MASDLPAVMRAVLLTGHGSLDKLEYREDVPVPQPGPDAVLIRVGACGMNNTDINTRIGWYSPNVTGGTTESGAGGLATIDADAAAWGGSSIGFPHIQGADVVGHIAAVGANVPAARVGERVTIDPWLRDPADPDDLAKARYFGSEVKGGFAEFCVAPDTNVHRIDSALSDAELATFPCSYSTGENMLARVGLTRGETILITGASGGVGSALIQLAMRRGATPIAVASAGKADALRDLGAAAVIPRDAPDLEAALMPITGGAPVDVAADVVGGDAFPDLLKIIRRGGRYVTAGAIAGPIVDLDLRILYLHDLALHGATVTAPQVFPNLVRYIEQGEVRPLLAQTFPLSELRAAQETFLAKAHVGNIVIDVAGGG